MLTDRHSDEGTTLVEMLVTMIILSIVYAGAAAAMQLLAHATGEVQSRSASLDRGRYVLDRMDLDLRWVVAVNRPVTLTSTAGTTQYLEYLSAATATTAATCTQWRYRAGASELDERTWPSATPPTTEPAWSTVLTGMVNGSSALPFTMIPASSTQLRQVVEVTIRLAGSQGSAETDGTATARNTSVSSVTNADTNGDGVSDTQVCMDFPRD